MADSDKKAYFDKMYNYHTNSSPLSRENSQVDETNLLCKAAKNGDFDEVRRLLDKKVSCQCCDHKNPLHYAIQNHHNEIAKYIIENSDVFVNDKTFDGETAFSLAEDDDMREFLLDHGAKVLMTPNTWQFLWYYDYEICLKVDTYINKLIRDKIKNNKRKK